MPRTRVIVALRVKNSDAVFALITRRGHRYSLIYSAFESGYLRVSERFNLVRLIQLKRYYYLRNYLDDIYVVCTRILI